MEHTNDHRPIQSYTPDPSRYKRSFYRRVGKTGLQLPLVSLGLWHNFGEADDLYVGRQMLRKAFDLGITHFDLANNYGPPYGSAEENFGRLFRTDFLPHRDELIIATKAGYDMWPGPYGSGGSRKYLMSSLDQSLRRMGLDYVDIYYHHAPDPDTPLEETFLALSDICRQGKALYVGISNYNDLEQMRDVCQLMDKHRVPFVLNQLNYSMFRREPEIQMDYSCETGYGIIAFSPLAQGVLTDKYIHGIPENSRASNQASYLKGDSISREQTRKVSALNQIAIQRGQSLAQMALCWILRNQSVSSVLVGSSRVEQLEENVKIMDSVGFEEDELAQIEDVLGQ